MPSACCALFIISFVYCCSMLSPMTTALLRRTSSAGQGGKRRGLANSRPYLVDSCLNRRRERPNCPTRKVVTTQRKGRPALCDEIRWRKGLWHFGARGVPACVALHPAADVRQRNAGTKVLWDILGLRQAPRAATVGVARLVGELGAARVERGIFAAIAPGPTPSSASTSVVVVHNASHRA